MKTTHEQRNSITRFYKEKKPWQHVLPNNSYWDLLAFDSIKEAKAKALELTKDPETFVEKILYEAEHNEFCLYFRYYLRSKK